MLNNEALLKRDCVSDSGIFLRSDSRECSNIEIHGYDDFVVVDKYIGSVINEDEI